MALSRKAMPLQKGRKSPFYCADCDRYYKSGHGLILHVAHYHDPKLGAIKATVRRGMMLNETQMQEILRLYVEETDIWDA